MEAMNPQRDGASLGMDESFCVISPDGSSMMPPAGSAHHPVATSTVGAVSPPGSTSQPFTGQYPATYETAPPVDQPATPAGPPPTQGPYTGGRLSALRPKHQPNLPPAVSSGMLFQPADAPEQQAGSYQALAQGHGGQSASFSPLATQGQQMTSVQFGQTTGPPVMGYGSSTPEGYGQGAAGGDQESGLWGWVQQATTSVVESAQKIVNNPDLIMEGAQKLGRNIVDKTKVPSLSLVSLFLVLLPHLLSS